MVVNIQKFKPDFLRNYCADLNQNFYESFQVRGKEFDDMANHVTKMAAMLIYGKNPSIIFSSETGRPISTKFGMKHRGL